MRTHARYPIRRRTAGLGGGFGLVLLALVLAGCGDGETAEEAHGRDAASMEAMEMPGMEGSGQEPGMADMQGMEGMPGMADMPGMPVTLTPEQASRLGLVWGEVEPRPLVRTVRTSAIVEYPESEMYWVSPKVGGWVERLHANFEGTSVRAGEPLLELYSPELVSAQEELLLARRLGEDLAVGRAPPSGEGLLATARRRLAFWDIDEAQIDRILETGEVTKTLTLRSPRTGVVMRKEVAEGQAVRAGENLLMIAPTDPIWIRADVFEQDLAFIRQGQPVRVRIQGLPGRELHGRVSFVYPNLRESTRSLSVRIEVPNPDGSIRPGMYATAELESRTEPVLSLPRSAVLHTGRREVVFADGGGGRLLPLEVRTGREGDEWIELLEGVEEGRRVALSALYLLDSEANLMEAMRAMMAEMGRMEMEDMEMDMDTGGMDGMEVEEGEMPSGRARDTTTGGGR